MQSSSSIEVNETHSDSIRLDTWIATTNGEIFFSQIRNGT